MDSKDGWVVDPTTGEAVLKCSPDCDVEWVRPGKTQCSCDDSVPQMSYQEWQALQERESNVDKYGRCLSCGHRAGVSCTCGMSFKDKVKTVGIDYEALRKFHGR